jgi:hypothetical protein
MREPETQLNVLALNSGSSSLKFGLYCVGSGRFHPLCAFYAREAKPSGAANRIRPELWTGPLDRAAVVLFAKFFLT